MPDKDVPITLDAEIRQAVAHHARWQSHDFVLAQALLWIGIFTSAFASLQAALKLPLPTWLTIILPAIPGVVIVVDKTFKHAARSTWHAMYGVRLRALARELTYRGGEVAAVTLALNRVESEMEPLFPPLSVHVTNVPPSSDQ